MDKKDFKSKKLLAAIYSQPEHYPPTLNAIGQLSSIFDAISLVFRPLSSVQWAYANNVTLHLSGEAMSVREQEQLPAWKKIKLFIGFIWQLASLCNQEKPEVVLLYDPLALAAFSFAKKFIAYKPIIWYHNHDVLETNGLRTFSINWIAARQERAMFPNLDIFTLPAEERKACFPMGKLKGQYFFLPNLPSVAFYRQFADILKPEGMLRLIYQGVITSGHGIEEIISMMPFTVNGKPVRLVLKGWLVDDFKPVVEKLIAERGVEKEVEFVGYTAYQELPKLSASCHVGIAIYAKTDLMNKTLGTASNKIYEYAAVGLPVLYFDNEHFRQHLGKFAWAVPTQLSAGALMAALEKIAVNHDKLTADARKDFSESLNYEHFFQPIGRILATSTQR